MKLAITVVLAILSFPLFGNDGVYLTRGGLIYPTKETKIALNKEILSFTVSAGICQVNIHFEFNNPENLERKLLIGFQAPAATGDVPDEMNNINQIFNFCILKDEQILPYKIKMAECEDCELKEMNELRFSQFSLGVFVYLFDVTFKPGINKINHSYSFPASSNVSIDQFYSYILTTGAKWANGKIKDLTVQVDMGANKYFYVSDIFGQKADWSIIGSGKVTGKRFDYGEDTGRMVRIISGKLQIGIKDFNPAHNIEFGIINEDSFISTPTDWKEIKIDNIIGLSRLTLEGNYSKEELKLLRNTVYAQYGYAFKSKDLQDYFSQFEWYMPDPNLAMEHIVLTEKENKFIAEIVKKEKE